MRGKVETSCPTDALLIAHSPPGKRRKGCDYDNGAISSTALAERQSGCSCEAEESSELE